MHADQGGDDGTCCSSSDDARQETTQVKCLDYTQVTDAKYLSALQHQRRSTEGLPRVVEHVQLGLDGQARIRARCSRVLREVFDGERDLGDIVLDQELGAAVGTIEQARCGDVAQVA